MFDAPPNFLKDSNASPKVKIMKEEGVGVRFLARNTFKIRRVCWSSRMGTKTNEK